jgi:two-component system LytT family sensor kinase
MVLLFTVAGRIAGFRLDPIDTVTTFCGFFSRWIYSEMITYLALAALVQMVMIYRHNRRQDLRASRLETELAQAQLQALKMQIHPHFLFNTLNTISGCVYKDRDLAVRMISRLSELLRLTLETGEETEIPLSDEVTISEKYLAIEQLRFADRLKVEIEMDPLAGDQLVPALILQPLVENAVRHGISPRIEGGTITIRAGVEKERLVITVCNDGEDLRPSCRENGEGIGLKNIRSRLRQRYGDAASLVLSPIESGGCCARVTLPLNFPAAAESRP